MGIVVVIAPTLSTKTVRNQPYGYIFVSPAREASSHARLPHGGALLWSRSANEGTMGS